jgi:gas vesicle protein
MNGVSDELERSEIDEVIFEHPGLEICRQGVEIIDSPGLNEHPDRTRITHKLIAQADAVIFLANAYRPFTQTEKELLQGLKVKLAGEQPANNLFVVMNFMDLLRRESDRQQVRQLAENFVSGKIPLVSNQNRLHFISAQESLEAILNGKENEYLENFRAFTQELEGFLTHESGNQLIQKARRQLDNIGNSLEVSLDAARNNLDSQVDFSYTERQEVLEKIGEITGRSQKLKILLEEKRDDTMVTIESQWPSRWEALKQTIIQKSAVWKSSANDSQKITQDFSEQLLNDVSIELDTMTKQLHSDLVQPVLEAIMTSLQEEIHVIQKILTHLDLKLNSQLNRQYELSISRLNNKFSFDLPSGVELENNASKKYMLIGGGSGIVAGAIWAVAATGGLALIPGMLIGGIYGLSQGLLQKIDPSRYRRKILETGLKQLNNQQHQGHKQVIESIDSKFYQLSGEIESEFLSVINLLNDVLSKREQALRKSDEIRQQEMNHLKGFQKKLENLTQQI